MLTEMSSNLEAQNLSVSHARQLSRSEPRDTHLARVLAICFSAINVVVALTAI